MPTNTHNFSPYSAEQEEIARQRALAQALQQEGSQGAPAGQMAGQVFVPTSPLLHLAKALKGVSGGMHERQAAERAKALQSEQEQRRGADMSLLAQALQGRQASPGGLMEDASGNVTQADPMAGQTPVQSLGQALPMLKDPAMQQAGFSALQGAQTRADQQKFQAQQAEENRIAKLQERALQIEAAQQTAGQNREMQERLARMADETRRELASAQRQTQMAVAGMAAEGRNQAKIPPGYRATPDGNMEAVPGGPADLKLQGAFNQDTAAMNNMGSSMDRLATAANEVLQSPGLGRITGIAGVLPNVPGMAGADAQAKLQTLKAQVGFGVLQEMRNASKTGGALGAVTEKIVDYTQGAKGRLREAFNLKHSAPQRRATDNGAFKVLGVEGQ
jgi:hypothetical protein